MFYINDDYYTTRDLEKQFSEFEKNLYIHECNNRRYAVCLSDTFQCIALCLFIRQQGGTILPIHPFTPKEAAIRMASSASSNMLFYQTLDSVIMLTNEEHVEEGGLIQMSSGTTGSPKCIKRTWTSIEEELKAYVLTLPIDRSSKSIIACPVTHSYGLISGVLASLERGDEPLLITILNPKYILKKLQEHPSHILYAAPALLHTISCLAKSKLRLDKVMTSGTMIPESWLESIKEVSTTVLQQYGCSEVGCITIHPDLHIAREVGYPLPHIKVEAGEIGNPSEIVVHSSRGTIYTKDLGYIKDGVLSFLSRMDDMINVAGLNVYPQEVEDVLLKEPRVVDVVVYKKPNMLSGERVCVQYVSNSMIHDIELREWCSRFLAPYQIPMEFIRVAQIEKLPNGKVSRKKLSESIV
ncbi:AMP-binding protein [Alkalihalobacillus sp. LMS39]|uniref:AMP-binding protein n=1 Tax=Alkalihalobacillus sp. LMS39 TaxID=2924032 RepID=UPI001FB37150|nr:AMP-binding protein [Alkalihalobacillus sp. LMS39]UOE94090.1 AMP-binding protein [Alkalihalobacillus sp. LMS39]